MKRLLHRFLADFGLHVGLHYDPYDDMRRMLENVGCCIDGGAYHGGASRQLVQAFPAAEIHAFEPQPDLAERLRSLSIYGVTVHQQALSDRAGTVTFHVPTTKPFTASVLNPGDSFGESESYAVEAVTIDSLELPVDVLKLDLQGNELAALRGATNTLPGVRAILCEVNFIARYQGCSLFHEVAGFLADRGFRLHRLYEIHSDRKGAWQLADAVFVR
jgi:FkbM family methyltransferase